MKKFLPRLEKCTSVTFEACHIENVYFVRISNKLYINY